MKLLTWLSSTLPSHLISTASLGINTVPSHCAIIGTGNGLAPLRRQAITTTNAALSSIEHLGTNSSEILIEIPTFLVTKMHFNQKFVFKLAAILSRPRCDIDLDMSRERIAGPGPEGS